MEVVKLCNFYRNWRCDMKIFYCFKHGCKKIKEEGSDEWVETKTGLSVLAGMKGVVLEPSYCDVHGAVLNGIAKENRLRNQIMEVHNGNHD